MNLNNYFNFLFIHVFVIGLIGVLANLNVQFVSGSTRKWWFLSRIYSLPLLITKTLVALMGPKYVTKHQVRIFLRGCFRFSTYYPVHLSPYGHHACAINPSNGDFLHAHYHCSVINWSAFKKALFFVPYNYTRFLHERIYEQRVFELAGTRVVNSSHHGLYPFR